MKRKGAEPKRRELPVRDDGQLYARVTKMLGNGRLLATCGDGAERMCKIRGSMRKREWVRVGDVVLVALREFQDEKADVVFKYQDAEVHRLRKLGEDLAFLATGPNDDIGDNEVVQFEGGDSDVDILDI